MKCQILVILVYASSDLIKKIRQTWNIFGDFFHSWANQFACWFYSLYNIHCDKASRFNFMETQIQINYDTCIIVPLCCTCHVGISFKFHGKLKFGSRSAKFKIFGSFLLSAFQGKEFFQSNNRAHIQFHWSERRLR